MNPSKSNDRDRGGPNLQNMFPGTEEWKRIRKALIPDNMQLGACNYSALELRILAQFAKEAQLK